MTKILYIIIAILIIALLFKCEQEPKIVTKQVTKFVTKHDTIKDVVISKPKTVYVTKLVTKHDTIIKYKGGKIKAKEYDTEIKTDSSSAKLKIITTGELLDVKGVISYKCKETTKETIKIKNKSGLFIYGNTQINNLSNIEAGLLYQFKNKIGLMGGFQYDNHTQNIYPKAGFLIKL